MDNVTFPLPVIMPMLPEIILAVLAMVILLWDVFLPEKRRFLTFYAALGSIIVTVAAVFRVAGSEVAEAFYGYFVLDPFAAFCKVLILAASGFAIVLSRDYMKGEQHTGEYYVLILFASLGMMLMVSSPNFVTMYLGMELMALCVYVLVGYQRDVLRSSEAALKYFILGALSSGMLLYGVSFFYGLTGHLDFNGVGTALAALESSSRIAVLLGLVFVISGLAFKVSVAPFHMWTPDAYEGAPTPITAFMSVGPKVAGFALILRLMADVLPSLTADTTLIFSWLAVLSMAIGNIAAIAQRNIKRMLAYSTIGHVGFVLLGVIAASANGYAGVLVYLAIYLFMTMGVFAIIILMRRENIQGELLDDFAGLSRVRPGYALAMGLLLFSLAGIPFLGGFWAKYAVFAAAIEAGHIYLAIAGIIFSAVGAFYYIRVVKYIYFDEERVPFNFQENVLMQATVVVSTVAVVALGLFPGRLMQLCHDALTGII